MNHPVIRTHCEQIGSIRPHHVLIRVRDPIINLRIFNATIFHQEAEPSTQPEELTNRKSYRLLLRPIVLLIISPAPIIPVRETSGKQLSVRETSEADRTDHWAADRETSEADRTDHWGAVHDVRNFVRQ